MGKYREGSLFEPQHIKLHHILAMFLRCITQSYQKRNTLH